jgi:hypothetical protein
MIKTFKGRLAGGAQERISLSTIQGKVGYRIRKFQTMLADPMDASGKSVVKAYQTEQSSVANSIDFTDANLLAVSVLSHNTTSGAGTFNLIVFDNKMVNQDIYITASANPGPVNYYIEIEATTLTDHAAEYTTIKDLRANG